MPFGYLIFIKYSAKELTLILFPPNSNHVIIRLGSYSCAIYHRQLIAWGNVQTEQSTVRKKMATGTFTYNALRGKTIKKRIKTQRKIVSLSNSTRAMLLV